MGRTVTLRNVTRTVTYVVHYKYPACFDDGGPFHDEYYGDGSKQVEATSDKAAQLASLNDEFWKKEHCRHNRYSFTVKIVKHVHEESEEGWTRDTETEIPRPTWKQCGCGQRYWPVKGEKACHRLLAMPA